MRGPTRKGENREGRKINLKRNLRREGGDGGKWKRGEGKREEGREERGEEGGEGTDGSLHPLKFLKVGAYEWNYVGLQGEKNMTDAHVFNLLLKLNYLH